VIYDPVPPGAPRVVGIATRQGATMVVHRCSGLGGVAVKLPEPGSGGVGAAL